MPLTYIMLKDANFNLARPFQSPLHELVESLTPFRKSASKTVAVLYDVNRGELKPKSADNDIGSQSPSMLMP
jgi:hypothetical protein